jgi:undecaprenyl-diphosphatase
MINGLPDVLKAPMWVAQLLGSLAFVAIAALASLSLARTRLGVALLLAIPLKLAFEWWIVKALVERERPFITVPEAVIREVNSSPLGFPSGHAILAFVVAGCLAPYLSKRSAVGLYLLAALTGIARVYLGAHNPLDAIAGAAIGVAIAAGLNLTVATPN